MKDFLLKWAVAFAAIVVLFSVIFALVALCKLFYSLMGALGIFLIGAITVSGIWAALLKMEDL